MRRVFLAALLSLLPALAHAQVGSPINNPCPFGSTAGTCVQAGTAITNVPSIALQTGGSISAASGGNLTINLGGNGTNLLFSGTGGTGTVLQLNAVTGGNTITNNSQETFQKPGTYFNLGTLTWGAGAWTPNSEIFSALVNETGTATARSDNTFPLSGILINTDNVAMGAGKEGIGFYVNDLFGGAAMTGDRVGISSHIKLTTQSGNFGASNNPNYVGGESRSEVVVNEGGSGLTVSTAIGHNFGGNDIAILSGTATDWYSNNGREIDIENATGTSVMKSAGLQIVHLSPHAVGGSLSDAGMLWGDQVSALPWQGSLMQIGVLDGQDPLASGTGNVLEWVISSNPATKAPGGTDGINLSLGTLTGKAFASRAFSVTGSGIISDYTAQIAQISNGVSIDAGALQQGGSPTISNAGSGNNTAGDWYTDGLSPQPGLYSADTVSGGAVTAITMRRPPYSSTQPATVVVTNLNASDGGTWTVGLTWTAKTTLSLNPTSGGSVLAPTPTAGDNSTKIATTAFVDASHPATNIVILTRASSSPWAVPAGVTKLDVTEIGAGGAGGSCPSGVTIAAAGGYSGTMVSFTDIVTPAANLTFSVGAGGSPGATGQNPGGNGGNTTFDSVSAQGGNGGSSAASGNAGANAGVVLQASQPTLAPTTTQAITTFVPTRNNAGSGSTGGVGANSGWGAGGAGGVNAAGTAAAAGNYGAGGGGCGSTASAFAGGAGMDGAVVIQY